MKTACKEAPIYLWESLDERHVARTMGNQAAPIPLADIHRLVH